MLGSGLRFPASSSRSKGLGLRVEATCLVQGKYKRIRRHAWVKNAALSRF